jgi:hypothetical protein
LLNLLRCFVDTEKLKVKENDGIEYIEYCKFTLTLEYLGRQIFLKLSQFTIRGLILLRRTRLRADATQGYRKGTACPPAASTIFTYEDNKYCPLPSLLIFPVVSCVRIPRTQID